VAFRNYSSLEQAIVRQRMIDLLADEYSADLNKSNWAGDSFDEMYDAFCKDVEAKFGVDPSSHIIRREGLVALVE